MPDKSRSILLELALAGRSGAHVAALARQLAMKPCDVTAALTAHYQAGRVEMMHDPEGWYRLVRPPETLTLRVACALADATKAVSADDIARALGIGVRRAILELQGLVVRRYADETRDERFKAVRR